MNSQFMMTGVLFLLATILIGTLTAINSDEGEPTKLLKIILASCAFFAFSSFLAGIWVGVL